VPYDHFDPPDRYWYAEDIKSNHEGIWWEDFQAQIRKSAIGDGYKGFTTSPPWGAGKFCMEFIDELGASAEQQIRDGYLAYNALTEDQPWFKLHYWTLLRAFVIATAKRLGITPAELFDDIKAEFYEITGIQL